jgi:hypothetical protein
LIGEERTRPLGWGYGAARQQAFAAGQAAQPETTLARLLARERGRGLRRPPVPLSERRILAWADAHHSRTGRWPSAGSGAVEEAPAEDWRALNLALMRGSRGCMAVIVSPHPPRCMAVIVYP